MSLLANLDEKGCWRLKVAWEGDFDLHFKHALRTSGRGTQFTCSLGWHVPEVRRACEVRAIAARETTQIPLALFGLLFQSFSASCRNPEALKQSPKVLCLTPINENGR